MKVKYNNPTDKKEQLKITLSIINTVLLAIMTIVVVIYLYLIWPLIPIFD